MSDSQDSFVSQKKRTSVYDQPVVRTDVQSALDSTNEAKVGNFNPQSRFGSQTREPFIAALVLACVVLFAHYVRVADYGFYEDDYWGIVPYFKTHANDLWNLTVWHLQHWATGRPLNHILPRWFSWLGYHLAGVQGIYFLGFLVHSTNAFLVYLLLRRWLGQWAAVLAGCLFVLIPTDTTRIFLLHSAHIHTALTFLLVALLVRRTQFWWASYPIAGLSLLSYETAFLPFIVFPLFFVDRQKRVSNPADEGRNLDKARHSNAPALQHSALQDPTPASRTRTRTKLLARFVGWLLHLAGCAAVLAIVFAIRLHLGDSRAASVISDHGEMLWRMASSLWIGPKTCLIILAKAALTAPHGQPPFAFLFGALVVLLLVVLPRLIDEPVGTEGVGRPRIVIVFLAGLASWIFAYALTLVNYPPTQEAGRLTSTHVAAVFGLTCAIAAVAAYFRSFKRFLLSKVVTILMSLGVGWLILYSFRIQSGFADSWTQERQFWQKVAQLCPDITPKTRIFLFGHEGRQNPFILANSWADPLVLGDTFAWKENDSPLLFYYDGAGQAADIRYANGQVTWKPQWWGDKRETLDLNNVIILQDDGKTLTRIDQFTIPEVPFPLQTKKLVDAQPHPSPTPLTAFGHLLLKP